MFVQVTQDYTPDLLQYLKQEPEEQEWATAGPKRDKSRSANAQKPLALFDRYCTEGKLLRSHIDNRQGAPNFNTLHMLCVPHAARNCNLQVLCFAESCLQSSQTATNALGLSLAVDQHNVAACAVSIMCSLLLLCHAVSLWSGVSLSSHVVSLQVFELHEHAAPWHTVPGPH